MIPYRNVKSLVGYYLGIFSLIPCLGLLLAIPAVVLGVMGMRFAKQHPEARGAAHGWVALITGGVSLLYHLPLFVMGVVARLDHI